MEPKESISDLDKIHVCRLCVANLRLWTPLSDASDRWLQYAHGDFKKCGTIGSSLAHVKQNYISKKKKKYGYGTNSLWPKSRHVCRGLAKVDADDTEHVLV